MVDFASQVNGGKIPRDFLQSDVVDSRFTSESYDKWALTDYFSYKRCKPRANPETAISQYVSKDKATVKRLSLPAAECWAFKGAEGNPSPLSVSVLLRAPAISPPLCVCVTCQAC